MACVYATVAVVRRPLHSLRKDPEMFWVLGTPFTRVSRERTGKLANGFQFWGFGYAV